MEQFKSETIEDVDLNERPRFYENMSAFPFLQRPAGKDARSLLLKIMKVVDVEFALTSNGFSYSGSETIQHNLGVAPFVLGELTLNGDYYPLPYQTSDGSFYFSFTKINNEVVEISADFPGEGTVSAKLYLLKLDSE
jgi:hypothetical protein